MVPVPVNPIEEIFEEIELELVARESNKSKKNGKTPMTITK